MIEIMRFTAINKGAVIASFAVKLPKMGGFCIYNLTLFDKDGQRWITFPSNKYEKDGKTKYFAHCGFESHDVNDLFKKQILEALDAHMAAKKDIVNDTPMQDDLPF